MALVQEEMGLLTEVEMPGGSIEQYVDSLDGVLQRKMEMLQRLRARLGDFKMRLQEEEVLSKTRRCSTSSQTSTNTLALALLPPYLPRIVFSSLLLHILSMAIKPANGSSLSHLVRLRNHTMQDVRKTKSGFGETLQS